MKYLVLGSSGQVGFPLTTFLKKNNHEVLEFDIVEDNLNDLNHDYQRMRKLGKKRINKNLTKFNKEQAKIEKEIQNKLGAESWVEIEKSWVRYGAWLLVGVLLGSWFL
jgi:nucleoside-diphosphate-sugar epimerase